jgi:hypothetical protein
MMKETGGVEQDEAPELASKTDKLLGCDQSRRAQKAPDGKGLSQAEPCEGGGCFAADRGA